MVDDDDAMRLTIATVIKHYDVACSEAASVNQALEMMAQEDFAIIFLDVRLPDGNGLDTLGHIMKTRPETAVIMITGYPTAEDAAKSFKLGGFDYLAKPISAQTLMDVTTNALDAANNRRNGQARNQTGHHRAGMTLKIIYKSPIMESVMEKTRSAARTDSTVLITGESGTGKDLIARMIHGLSERADCDYVPVDCSALVETLLESELFGHSKGAFTGAERDKAGLFELADKGTFFFDEIGNLSYNIQCKLLRVIQEREYRKVGSQERKKLDIRILSASNIDLMRAVKNGTFRNDLYYRINVVPIHLPPLRERLEDIPLLLGHFIDHYNRSHNRQIQGFSENALDATCRYPWPGNVRELRHMVEQIFVLEKTDTIRERHLPVNITRRRGTFDFSYRNGNQELSLEGMEMRYIQFILSRTGGIRQQAADILKINRKTLSAKIKKYGLDSMIYG
ncbi:MAG TPA: sigma-54-dependent Fis family transcriptional regulator [Deltaproteobacteria bacterium]|nr:sigma-54-dependent Fis family transcriptional regulator [Deltaproteobacteria bacterium]